MKKVILTIIPLFFLAACQNQTKLPPPKPVVYVISSVPAPPKVDKPILDITTLSELDKKDLGIVAKSYVVTVDQLKSYAHNLELIYDKYLELSKQNKQPVPQLHVEGLAAPIPPQTIHESIIKKP